jgi:hypothetical protein
MLTQIRMALEYFRKTNILSIKTVNRQNIDVSLKGFTRLFPT